MQMSTVEGLVSLVLNKVSKKDLANSLDMLMNCIHQVEKDLKHLPGHQKKEIVMKTLQNLQSTSVVASLPLRERQNYGQMLEYMDASIDLLVSAMNSKAFKKFRRNCLKK